MTIFGVSLKGITKNCTTTLEFVSKQMKKLRVRVCDWLKDSFKSVNKLFDQSDVSSHFLHLLDRNNFKVCWTSFCTF